MIIFYGLLIFVREEPIRHSIVVFQRREEQYKLQLYLKSYE